MPRAKYGTLNIYLRTVFLKEFKDYWSIALQMEHCFLAITLNLKWEF